MKQILKKNQIIISVIAIMLIAAGYMNYTSNEKQALETAVLTDSEKYAGIGDATLVSANVADNNDLVNNNEAQNITDESTKNEDKKDKIKSNEQNTEIKENDENVAKNREEDEKEEDLSEDEAITMENLRDLVEVMLFQELYKRRCDHRRCCRRFFK